jgi:signal transduction histidine kinase
MKVSFESFELYIRFKWVIIAFLAVGTALENALGTIGGITAYASYLGLLISAAMNFTLQLMVKRKKVPAAFPYFSLLLDLLILDMGLYLYGGPETIWWFLPVFVIFFAGYLFTMPVAHLYATLAILISAAIFSLEQHGLIPHFSFYGTPSLHWKDSLYINNYVSGLILLYLSVAFISGYLNQLSLRSSNQLEQSLKGSEEARSELESSRKILKEDMAKLKVVDRMKTEFLSMVSHELRTPMTPIKGYLTLISSGKFGALSPEQKNALNIIADQSEHLHSVIGSILDLSRIELGKPVPVNKTPVYLKPLIGETVEAMKIKAREQGLALVVEGAAVPKIMADPIMLKRVLANLIGNALKFTPRGGEIKIRACVEDSSVRVEVVDNGIGIARENLDKVFEKFYQVDASSTRAVSGMGMGLPIAKELVELHGGKIWGESEGLGRGSRFIFTLPVI